MKKMLITLAVAVVGYINAAHAEEPRTQKYFREHIEEARSVAKNCNIAQEECKNARRAVWFYDHSGNTKKTSPETKPKSEPVKK